MYCWGWDDTCSVKCDVLFISSPKSCQGSGVRAEALTGSPQPCHWPRWCPLPPRQSLGFPSTVFPCSVLPGHWQLLQGSLILVPFCPHPQTSATPAHLRRLFSLCRSVYLNVSLILHLQLQGKIKLTEKPKMQFTAKSINIIQPRENQSRYPVPLFVPSIFLVALFISLLLL